MEMDVAALTNQPIQLAQPTNQPVENDLVWTRKRVLVLVGLAAAQFFSYTSVFILSSFFPPLAEEKHVTGIELGLIIGIIQGIFTFAAYSFVQCTHKVSPKFQVILGLVVTGFGTVAFGFLDKLPDGKAFFVACLLVRVVQGVGIAASDLCVLIIANQVTPPALLGTVIGLLEFALAAAIALAPPIGGILFEVMGFYGPFLISGLTALLSAVVCYYVLPNKVSHVHQSLKLILKNSASFEMLVFMCHFMMGGGFSGFFAGIIEPHLRKFDLSPAEVGLVILITNAISGVTFPLWGFLTDKLVKPWIITILGCSLSLAGFVLFGPFPHLPFESSLWLICLSLILVGCGISAVLISSYTQAKLYLKIKIGEEDLSNSVISSSYPSTYNIGAFLGAMLGGVIVDYLDYRVGSAILFGIQLFGLVLHIILMIKHKGCFRRTNIK